MKLGKPNVEEAEQRKKEEAERPKAADGVPLEEERTDDLAAMEWVWDGKPVRSVQQRGFGELLSAEGRGKFFDRMQRMRGEPGAQSCTPEKDEGTERTLELIETLLRAGEGK